MNYCKNLWEQYAKVEAARSSCADILDLMNNSGGDHFGEIRRRLESFDTELRRMQEIWDEAFFANEEFTIFRDEYDFLALAGFDWEKLFSFPSPDIYFKVDRGRITTLPLIMQFVPGGIDLAGISRLSKLRELSLSAMGIKNTESIYELQNLEYLSAFKEDLITPERLAEMKSLKRLKLVGYSIDELDFLSGLQNLEELTVEGTHDILLDQYPWLENLSFLKGLRLNVLHINSYNLSGTDFSEINLMPSIKTLEIQFCQNLPTDLTFLAGHPGIEGISMFSQSILSDEPLEFNISALLTIPNLKYFAADSGSTFVPEDIAEELGDIIG